MIAKQEKILADLRARYARYRATAPDSPLRQRLDALLKGAILRIQEATGYLERHVMQMERSLEALQLSCDHNELHAVRRALHRLRADLSR